MTTATRTHSWLTTDKSTIFTYITQTKSLIAAAGLTAVSGQDTTPQAFADVDQSNSSSQGGITYQFPDSLQSTMPIYVRITFNIDGNYRPLVRWTVGSAYNANSAAIVTPNVTGATNPTSYQEGVTSYASYIDGSFSMVIGSGIQNGGQANNCLANLVVDRDRNTSGVAQGSGYLVEGAVATFTSTVYSRSLYGSASPDTSQSFVPSLIPNINATTSAEGANVNVFRHYSMTPGVKPHVGMLTYFNSEFGALTPFTATVLGSSHTYMPMGYAMNYWSANPVPAHCCAIRWE